jgi:Fe2+ or Zn2+ uptake regulation protein
MTEAHGHTTRRDPSRAELTHLLRSRGQRVTPQRIVILRELRRERRHLGADDVRQAISDAVPGISLPTVYATLDLFVELGLVRRLHVGGGVTLYDGRIEPHQHARCRICGEVQDVDGAPDDAALRAEAQRSGFAVEQVDVLLSGVCQRCRNAG